MKYFILGLSTLLFFQTQTLCVKAQEFGRIGTYTITNTSYHAFARPGEATIQVLVLGSVNAGIYEVGVGTDLGELLALTGTAIPERTKGEKRTLTIRLYREVDGIRNLIYEAPIQQMLNEPKNYPDLQGLVSNSQDGYQHYFTWFANRQVDSLIAFLLLPCQGLYDSPKRFSSSSFSNSDPPLCGILIDKRENGF